MAIRIMSRALVLLMPFVFAGLALAQGAPPPLPADPFEASTITADALARLIAAPHARLVLFDTRTAPEFEISHISDAIRIEPGPGADARLAPHMKKAEGADVVLYCTIGARSAGVANDALDRLLAAGARSVQVLELGLIGWANANLPLVDANERPTLLVHPFDITLAKGLAQPGRAHFGRD